jgi:type IV secretory pathway VirB10-like protein
MAAAPVDVDAPLREQILNYAGVDPARQAHFRVTLTAQLVGHPLGTASGEKRRSAHLDVQKDKRKKKLQLVVNELKAIQELTAEITMLEALLKTERSMREHKATVTNQRRALQAQIASLQMQMPAAPSRMAPALAAPAVPALAAPAPPPPAPARLVAPTINVAPPSRNREHKFINGYLPAPTPPSSPTEDDDGEDLAGTAASDEADLRRPGDNYDFTDGFLVDETAMETDG